MKYKKNDQIILKKDFIVPGSALFHNTVVIITNVDHLFQTYDIENLDGEYITDISKKELEINSYKI